MTLGTFLHTPLPFARAKEADACFILTAQHDDSEEEAVSIGVVWFLATVVTGSLLLFTGLSLNSKCLDYKVICPEM